MHDRYMEKTTFITELSNYWSQLMPFGLKNAVATY